jgi:two-component system cell cycle sensor histidine kinase/response regulator CckA
MGKKILVVDNHPVMLHFMTHLLEREGHQVMTAESGLDALDILTTYVPDVVFTDLIMPNINGEKLCQIIRRIPNLKEVYLIVLTAVAAEGEKSVGECGANLCIAKGPFDKMADHILTALNQMELKPSAPLTGQTVGLEGASPLQITEELLSIKKHFEATLRSMSEGILEITPGGRIIYANPVAISLTNMPEDKLIASNFTELFHDGDQQRVKNLFIARDTLPQTIPEENPVNLNGKQVSISIISVMDRDHKDTIVILKDVSDRKRIEAQLLHAQKMEAIGTLAGGIAHDFNNLLMVIQGNVSLLQLDIDTADPHYEMLQNIEKKIQSGAKLTSQLLGYASQGRYEIKLINLNQLLGEISETFGRTRKNITIHRELAEDLFPVEADQGQIEQTLLNLMVNASEAMPRGGELFLKTFNICHEDIKGKICNPKTGSYVLLTATDTGAGMDSKTLERIFDPFFTTKELGRGTGLGLASVYGIIKGHGGYIDVESEKGRGTTFKIYLPASDKKIQNFIKTPDPVLKGKETLLLIDDEESVLDVGQKLLMVMGYRVVTARNGKEAIQVYKKHRDTIDLVILDIIMPDTGGGEVFDRLKEINPDIKVLLSSGYSIDGEATKILARGGYAFIQKPFDIKQLSQSIREILNEKSDSGFRAIQARHPEYAKQRGKKDESLSC